MSHILKKISIAGGGGSSKPKPPLYKPPVLGELQYGASYSYAETLDLISDGPIEGLVDRDGKTVDGLNILQGIYLDNTPVAITNRPKEDTNTDLEADTADLLNMELKSDDTSAAIFNCQKFFEELGEADFRSSGGKVSALNNTAGVGINGQEANAWPSIPMFVVKTYNPASQTWSMNSEWWIRAFISSRTGGPTPFPWYLNEERQTAVGITDANALFYESEMPQTKRNALFWADADTTADSNFLVGMNAVALEEGSIQVRAGHNGLRDVQSWRIDQYFPESLERVRDFIQQELNTLIGLVDENRVEGGNPLQLRLAERALSSLGWAGGSTNTLVEQALSSTTDTDSAGEAYAIVVVKANESGNTDLVKNIVAGGSGSDIILNNMRTRPYGVLRGWSVEAQLKAAGVKVFDITCPTIDTDGRLTGTMHGCVIYKVPLEIEQISDITQEMQRTSGHSAPREVNVVHSVTNTFSFPERVVAAFKDIESFRYSKTLIPASLLNEYTRGDLKFNYTNVLAEIKTGEEFQSPFNYFRTVFIDHPYNRELFGPFNVSRQAAGSPVEAGEQKNAPQRISANSELLTRAGVLAQDGANFNTDIGDDALPVEEGSDDQRTDSRGDPKNYSDWAQNSVGNWDEDGIPVVHTIYNPNVTRVFITLNINELSDTLIKKVENVEALGNTDKEDLDVGTKFPTVLNIKVETGVLGEGGETDDVYQKYIYRVVALIDSATLIDIGNPDYRGDSNREFIVSLDGKDSRLSGGFDLPPTINNKQVLMDAFGIGGVEAGVLDQASTKKRYIKISKVSFETNSVLIHKVVNLQKVTEIIDVPLPYPFSAIIGTKIDSRSFSTIPQRSFDCKLKKVKIPSNYFPTLDNGKDKRYHDTSADFDNSTQAEKLVYKGDWNGSFKPQLEWTDNPAWILYDLLTNSRYGMGAHIDISDINKWQLYKIGRFCDAVDDNGFFEGVTDGRGGKEPRFSCNIVFDKGQKIFDAITTIAGLFRGRVFFGNSEINFVDDRPRTALNIFTNESVKDGLFHYSNNRRDEQFNCIEVGFKDRFDNFSPQIEVVEDEDNIKEKGVFKKRIEGIGITSRAMARRVAQHQIFSKIKENQQVAFTAGLETLLCQPGDLVFIEDDLKTNKANFGKILAVDLSEETIRVSNTFVESDMTGRLTVIDPTGRDASINITTGYGTLHRERFYNTTVTGAVSDAWVKYTGVYGFSGYTQGYEDASGKGAALTDPRFQQYALYSGTPTSGTMLYFETGVTGWVFASGTGEGNSGAFALASGDFISELTGTQTLAAMGTGKIAPMIMVGDKRSTPTVAFSGFDSTAHILKKPTRGALVSDLGGLNPEQLKILNVTGAITVKSYGSVLSGFDKPEVLPFVKLGSTAKLEIKDASPFIYKVLSMKEENPNEYLVTASKYETGKFKLIEDDVSIEEEANTFSYQVAQTINDVTYTTLPAPKIYSLTTGLPDVVDQTFTISGDWSVVPNSTGYNMVLTHPNGQTTEKSVTTTGDEFSDLRQVGVFNFCVNALGNKGGDCGNAYFDSAYDCSGIFVVYDELLTFGRSFIDQITIL